MTVGTIRLSITVVITHAELIAASPLYAQLAATQFLVPSAYRD